MLAKYCNAIHDQGLDIAKGMHDMAEVAPMMDKRILCSSKKALSLLKQGP